MENLKRLQEQEHAYNNECSRQCHKKREVIVFSAEAIILAALLYSSISYHPGSHVYTKQAVNTQAVHNASAIQKNFIPLYNINK